MHEFFELDSASEVLVEGAGGALKGRRRLSSVRCSPMFDLPAAAPGESAQRGRASEAMWVTDQPTIAETDALDVMLAAGMLESVLVVLKRSDL